MRALLAAEGPVLIMAGGTGGLYSRRWPWRRYCARGVAVFIGVPGSMESNRCRRRALIEGARRGIRGKGPLA